jgi:hypothetical protein
MILRMHMFCISLNWFSIIVWPKMEIIGNSIPGRESVRERVSERAREIEKWSESLIAIYSSNDSILVYIQNIRYTVLALHLENNVYRNRDSVIDRWHFIDLRVHTHNSVSDGALTIH